MSLTKLYKKAGVKFWLQFPFKRKKLIDVKQKSLFAF